MKTLNTNEVIVDLTAAPYHCDPTGERDCTEALCRALDDAMEADRQAQLGAIERMSQPDAEPEGPETLPSGVHFPRNAPPATILYLPSGTYRVSNTIGYSWSDHVNSKCGDHLARGIHWLGDGISKTIIRVEDNCPAFQTSHGRAVFEIQRGLKSAVCMQNTVESLSIHTGSGNPGAIGVDFYANNTGALRDVSVESGDGSGIAGVAIRKWNSSCVLMQRIRVNGFQFGVQILHHRLYTVLDDIEVSGQSVSGVWIDDHNIAVNRLRSRNSVPALTVVGSAAVVCAVDIQADGGSTDSAAVDLRAGVLTLRDLRSKGYGHAIAHHDGTDVDGPDVSEWLSHLAWKLFSDHNSGTLRLPIENAPAPTVGIDASDWRSVAEFGAAGDGRTDDTDAIEQAFDSGTACIHFPRGRFLITRPIRIPASVQRIDFRFADLEAGQELKAMDNQGAFLIGDGEEPLCIERLFTMTGFMGKHRLLEQDGVRTVILRDLHTQYNGMYRNTVPGSRIFIENCACTTERAEHLHGFHFTGQQVWARQLNPERSHVQVVNDGGSLWVLGFKTENPSVAYLTRNGGKTEILGGIFNQNRNYSQNGKTAPTIINDESAVSVVASTTDWRMNHSFQGPAHVVVRETRDGITRDLYWEVLPLRQQHLVAIPLYSGGK